MSSDPANFEVEIDEFAERHFIKSFRKKYKRAWEVTEIAIVQELKRVDNLVGLTDKAEVISSTKTASLVKLNFKIAGTNESAKSSGNRVIVFVDTKRYTCRVLLVYSKNEICQPNETQKWQMMVKENFSDVWWIFHDR